MVTLNGYYYIMYVYIILYIFILVIYHISILNKLGLSGYVNPNDDISCLFKWYYIMVCVCIIYIYTFDWDIVGYLQPIDSWLCLKMRYIALNQVVSHHLIP